MRHQFGRYLLTIVTVAAIIAGCSRNGETRHQRQPSGIRYTEDRAMDVYANNSQRALQLVDSARTVGNLTARRADLLRATIYSRTFDSPRHDSAIVIAERLLASQEAKNNPTFRQDVLEVLVNSSRQIEDDELLLVYNNQLTKTYRQRGLTTEALRSKAELGAVLYRLGKTDEGLAKMDNVIRLLLPVRRFNEMDASIIAMKRKMGVTRDYPQIITIAQQLLDRLKDYEQHPADYHDNSDREPDDSKRPGYIAFYRAQAQAYLAAAYAHLHKPQQARAYLTLVEESDFGHTLAGKKMMGPTLCLLGEYGKMETIYKELEHVFVERGDTLTLDYAQLLLDRAKAAEAQARMSESTALWEKHALILQKAEERLLRGKANLYAALYHAQEQQMVINQQQALLARRNIITIALAIGLVVLIVFTLYVLRQQHIIRRKNDVLARGIYKTVKGEKQQADAGASPSGQTPDEQLFQHIREVVMRDELFLDPKLNRQQLTDILSLSKERIGAAFSKGSPYKSVTDFINDCRLPYAAKMLIERPDLSIAEVAEASGFARPATFTTNFKKRYAITPAQYRERLLTQ